MKSRKATGPPQVRVKMMIVTSSKTDVEVMMALCQRLLQRNCREMLDECKVSVIGPIFKGKDNVISYGLYRGVNC